MAIPLRLLCNLQPGQLWSRSRRDWSQVNLVASVLIIEDSPTEAHVFQRALEQQGHSVEVATDGASGIDRAVDGCPDVILMDIVMPGVNGFQATRELRKFDATAAIPIIMISTKGQETDRIWGMRQGACDYLVKPVSTSLLIDCVSKAVALKACHD